MNETIREKLRAVHKAGVSLYSIAKACDMKWDTLKRFLDGDNLRGNHLDALAEHLSLEVREKRKPRGGTKSA